MENILMYENEVEQELKTKGELIKFTKNKFKISINIPISSAFRIAEVTGTYSVRNKKQEDTK